MMKIVERNTEKEKWALAEMLSQQFIQRQDLHARQLDDGRYVMVKRRYSTGLMYLHLMGQITLGAYLLDLQSQARFMVLDADDDLGFEGLKRIARDLPAYLECSRRGGHLWVFFSEPISGEKARRFGLGLCNVHELEAEVFPKQDRLVDGPGSLIRVPFGIHRKTGCRYGFINPDGEALGTTVGQIATLSNPQAVPMELVNIYQYQEQKKPIYAAYTGLHEDLKSIPLTEFIGQYVALRPIASGALGLCPFHEDHRPSFGVNSRGNYWYCFAGCGGGDIVSFWMKLKNCDFTRAVKELKEVLNGPQIG